MSRTRDRKQRRAKIKRRFREAVRGTAERPRLCVYRSLRYIYAQVVDDERGHTLASASTFESEVRGDLPSGGSCKAGERLGKLVAERAKEQGIESVVFDRGGFTYHGVIRAVADAAREAGLKF
jgi:large subunit ribosomal protein L18